MKVQQISTSSCQTAYQVGDYRVNLWVIAEEGEPCLAFDDHSFSERFPVKDKRWTSDKFWLGRYHHQDPDNMQGPTFEVLPDGEKTLINFVERNGPVHQTNKLRWTELVKTAGGMGYRGDGLTNVRLVSRRIHDKANHSYGFMEADVNLHYFGRVLFSSSSFSGRPDYEIMEKNGKWWKEYADFITPLVDSNRRCYYKLTDEEYQQFLNLMKRGFESKAFT